MEYKTISKYENLSGHFSRKIEQHTLMHPKAYDAAMEHVEKQFLSDNPEIKFNPKQHLEQYKNQFVDHVMDSYTVKAKEFFHHPDIDKADLDRLVKVYTDQTREGLHDLLQQNKYDIDLKKFSEYTANNVQRFNAQVQASIPDMVGDDIVKEVIDKYKLAEHPKWDLYKERFDKVKAIQFHTRQTASKQVKGTLDDLFV